MNSIFEALKQMGKTLFTGGPLTFDIKQGGLKSCFFYAGLATLLHHPNGVNYIRDAFPYYNEV